MISYAPLWQTMKRQGASTYTLQVKGGISSSTIRRLKAGDSVSTNTLDALCKILQCTIPDILEYVAEEKIAPALSLTRRGFDFPYSLFIPAQILRCCRLTHFFSLLPSDPLSDPEPVTSLWNSHLYVGYVLRKPPANTPGKGTTGLYVTANHPHNPRS